MSGNAADQREARPHGALGVVLVRLRPAEIHQHAVARVLRHETAEAGHDLAHVSLISEHYRAQVLGVESHRERSRVDEVAEQHGDLTPLRRRSIPLGCGHGRQRRTAMGAEPRSFRYRGLAARTQHSTILPV
jgi:hypothetical protein